MGDQYLRRLLVMGMTSLVRRERTIPVSRSTPRRSARAQAREGRHRRHGQQDRTDHLGHHGTWRNLSYGPPAGTGSITTIRISLKREISFRRLRGRCEVMANRSDRERGQPNLSLRRHSPKSRMGPRSRTPSGPAVSTDAQQAGHKTAPDQRHYVKLPLATREPSTQDFELGHRGMSETRQ